jgi:hypothetical protein
MQELPFLIPNIMHKRIHRTIWSSEKNVGYITPKCPSSNKSGFVPERFQKMVISKKIVYKQTTRKQSAKGSQATILAI